VSDFVTDLLILLSLREQSELSQWPSDDDSILNIVIDISIILCCAYVLINND